MLVLALMPTLLCSGTLGEVIDVGDVESLLAAAELPSLPTHVNSSEIPRFVLAPSVRSSATRTIVVREGVYELPRSLVLRSGHRITSHPGHEVRIQLAATVPHPVVSMHNVTDVTVSGIMVVGHNHSTEQLQRAMAVEIVGGADVTLYQLTVVGGVRVTGGWRHHVNQSNISNPHGAAGGHCVYFTSAGDALTLAR